MLLLVTGALSLAAIVASAVGLLRPDPAAEPAGVAADAAVTSTPSPFAGSTMPPGVRAPDFRLRNQDGKLVSMRSLRGRPVLVTFLYTQCLETCPAEAQQIKGALDQLGHDVPVVAISVDPARDTQAGAHHFLAEAGMSGRMEFVLGRRAQLRPLWKGFAIQPQLPDTEHQARIVLVDQRGFQRVGFPIGQTTPERIAHDLRVLGA